MKCKPCPFCGSTGYGIIIKYTDEYEDRMYYIFCLKCEAQSAPYRTSELAGDAWNSRNYNDYSRGHDVEDLYDL